MLYEVNTNVVLIIREMQSSLPSFFLKNKVPRSIIFSKYLLYHTSPHVFRCTCFVHNVFSGLNRLSKKTIKCVFFRYSRRQKGYKCYSPSTKRYYMCADVTFSTNIFSCPPWNILHLFKKSFM